MKKYGFLFFVLVFAGSCIIYVPTEYGEPPPPEEEYYGDEYREYPSRSDVSHFYDYLSPYGMWVYHSPHGYVWIPRIDRYGWHPYTHGQWIWTDYGWTWSSHFNWGWAPFHYGRWGWDDYLGWYWIPGIVWGPAWVTWRWGSFYVGWAPLPPGVNFRYGVGITSLPFRLRPNFWVFVEGRNIFRTRIYRYVLPRERNVTIINYTVIKTNIIDSDRRVINKGIDIDHIRKVSRQKIIKHELMDTDRPGQSRVRIGKLEVFRPNVRKNEAAKPKTVVNKQEAVEKISKVRIRKPGEISSPQEETRQRDSQRRERILLDESQEKEKKELMKKSEEENSRAGTSSEKRKVQKAYKEKLGKMEENHKAEKSKLKKRHKDENEKTKKKKVKK